MVLPLLLLLLFTSTCNSSPFSLCGTNYVHHNEKSKQTFLSGLKHLKQSKWATAARSFQLLRHLTRDEPDNGTPLCYHVAAVLAARGEKEALRILDAAAQPGAALTSTSSPAHVGLQVIRGNIHTALSDNTQALLAYDQVLRINPAHLPSLLGRANILVLNNNEQDRTAAKNILTRVITSHPSLALAHRMMGQLFGQANDYATAETHYATCVALQPTDYNAHYEYGRCLAKHADILSKYAGTTDTTLAVRTLQKSVAHLQQSTWLLKESSVNLSGGTGAENIASTRSTIYFLLGETLFKQARYRDAIEAYRKSVSSSPSSCPGMHRLTVTLAMVGQTNEANAMAHQLLLHCGDQEHQQLQAALTQIVPAEIVKPATGTPTPVQKKRNRTAELKAEEQRRLAVSSSSVSSPTVTVTMGGSGGAGHTIVPPSVVSSGVGSTPSTRDVPPAAATVSNVADCDVHFNHNEEERELVFNVGLNLVLRAHANDVGFKIVPNNNNDDDDAGNNMEASFLSSLDTVFSSKTTASDRGKIINCFTISTDSNMHGSLSHYALHRLTQQPHPQTKVLSPTTQSTRHLKTSVHLLQPTHVHYAAALNDLLLLTKQTNGVAEHPMEKVDVFSLLEKIVLHKDAAPRHHVRFGQALAERGEWARSADHLYIGCGGDTAAARPSGCTFAVRKMLAKTLHLSGAPQSAATLLGDLIKEVQATTSDIGELGMLMVAAGNACYDNGDIQQAANYYVDATSDKNNSNSRYHLIQLLVDDQQQKLSVQYIHQLILLETQDTTGDAAAVPSENLLTVGSTVFWDAGRIQESNIFSERLLSTTATASTIGQMLVNRIVQGYVQMGRYNQALDMYQLGCKGQSCEDEALEQELRANEMDYHDARKQLSVHNPQEDNLDTARLAYALAPENTKAEMALALVKRLYANDNNAVKEEITDILKEEYEISTTKSTTMALRVHMTWAEHLFSGGTAFAVEKATEIARAVDDAVGVIDAGFLSRLASPSLPTPPPPSPSFLSSYTHAIQQRFDLRVRSLRLLATAIQQEEELLNMLISRKESVALDYDLLITTAGAALGRGQLSVASEYFQMAMNKDNNNHDANPGILLGCRLGHVYINNEYTNESADVLEWMTVFLASSTATTDALDVGTQRTVTVFQARVSHARGKTQEAIDLLLPFAAVPIQEDKQVMLLPPSAKVSDWSVVKNPELSSMGYYTLGSAYRSLGQHSMRAAWSFHQCMHLAQKNALHTKTIDVGEIEFQLGSSLLEGGQYVEALRYLSLAKNKRPKHSPTLNNLGVLFFRTGRIQEAKRTMKLALSIQDGCLNRFNLGVLLQEHTRSWSSSAVQYRQALQQCGYAFLNNTDHVKNTGGANGALSPMQYDGITTLHKDIDVVYLNGRLAKVLEAGNQYQDALRLLKQTLGLLQERAVHQETSLLFSSLSSSTLTVVEWTSMWRNTNATTVEMLFQTSSLLSTMGQHAEALSTAEQGRAMVVALYTDEKDHCQSLIELGNAYLHAGRLQMAEQHYRHVLNIEPQHSTGLNNHGIVLYQLKKYEAAYDVFAHMLKLNARDKRALDMMKALPRNVVRKKQNVEKESSSSWMDLFGALTAD